jgi:hypothetical protein
MPPRSEQPADTSFIPAPHGTRASRNKIDSARFSFGMRDTKGTDMIKAVPKLAFLFLVPAVLLAGGCDRALFDLTSGDPPPCVIGYEGASCEPPPTPEPPIVNRG